MKGQKSSPDDQATVLAKASELDAKLFEGKSLLVKLCEAKECNHFMAMFDGRIAIFRVIKDIYILNKHELKNDLIE